MDEDLSFNLVQPKIFLGNENKYQCLFNQFIDFSYTLYSRAHVCWSEHSDSSFIYGFMSLDYGLGTMTATTKHKLLLECTVDGASSKIPTLVANVANSIPDGRALPHPYHDRRSCSKFGLIPPSSLGENSVKDEWTDADGRKYCFRTP